jgi:hypothetical protein
MEGSEYYVDTERYAKCIEGSKRIRWDIDKDVIRGREFDFSKKFLPDGITKLDQLPFLSDDHVRVLGQIQGRTYCSMFGFVERFITAKILEISRDHWLGDQIALEALVRFCDEELKHQELFRRLEIMIAEGMPEGYRFPHDPNAVAGAILSKSTWAVMALIYEIELFTQEHYKQSIEPDENLDQLFKDVFLFHWKEEAHHAVMDALEWPREDAKLAQSQRDAAVGEVIELVSSVDGLLQAQRNYDAEYFLKVCNPSFTGSEIEQLNAGLLKAYRWQYIFSGVEHVRFQGLLGELTTDEQRERLGAALSPLL